MADAINCGGTTHGVAPALAALLLVASKHRLRQMSCPPPGRGPHPQPCSRHRHRRHSGEAALAVPAHSCSTHPATHLWAALRVPPDGDEEQREPFCPRDGPPMRAALPGQFHRHLPLRGRGEPLVPCMGSQLAEVKARGRVHGATDWQGCPHWQPPWCRATARGRPGDQLGQPAASPTRGRHSCCHTGPYQQHDQYQQQVSSLASTTQLRGHQPQAPT